LEFIDFIKFRRGGLELILQVLGVLREMSRLHSIKWASGVVKYFTLTHAKASLPFLS